MIDNDTVWEGEDSPGEGKMYCEEWAYKYDDPGLVKDALEWLCAFCTDFELDETIWPDFQ